MSVAVRFWGDGDDGPFQVATANGWRLFCEWASKLPGFPALKELARDGASSDTSRLSQQLRAAIKLGSPPPAVRSTAEGFLARVGVGHEDEQIQIMF